MKRCGGFGVGLALLCAASCGGGGGGDGRPPTVVTGNVLSVTGGSGASSRRLLERLVAWLRADAVAQVPGIVVSIDATEVSDTTDENGVFRLEGNQFGPVTLRFNGGAGDGTFGAVLPSGGTLELVSVRVTGSDVSVDQQNILFRGPITGVDCQGSLLQVLSGSLVAFRVRLTGATQIRDEGGFTLACGDLTVGSDAEVQAVVDEGDTVIATVLQVNPDQVAPPTATPENTNTPTPSTTQTAATPTRTATRTPTIILKN